MGPEREVTNAELAAKFDVLRDEVREDLRVYREETVRKDVYDANRIADASEQKHIEYRLNQIEQRNNFNRQLALGGLVLPILVIVIGGLLLALVMGGLGQ